MPMVKDAPAEMNKIMEAAYSSALKKYPGNKAKASKIAYGAAKNAGFHKGKGGKWMKKEMSEEIVIDAFKEGKYPQGEFTGKELAEIASTYNPEVYEAPILIGHLSDPSYKGKSTIPAFGWIGKAKVIGDHLKLVVSQFSEQLKELIQGGFYKKVSAAFFQPDDPNNPTPGKWHLHHLAFLGGTPPAVKGLEGIAFAEIQGSGVEFAEMDTAIEGMNMDDVESAGTDDTIKDLTECCATFISKIQDALTSGIDSETAKSRCSLAAYDLQTEIQDCLNMQWMFTEKLENLEEHGESEMSEKSFKQVLIEMAQKFINKRKENNVDAKKEQEYQAKIAEQDALLKEFAEKERLAKEAADKVEQEKKDAELKAAEEAQKTEIKAFCEQAQKDNRMTPAMRNDVKDDKGNITKKGAETVMFELAKTSPDALKLFQEQFTKEIVPLGETQIGEEKKNEDGRSLIFKQAEAYVKAHKTDKEFAELSEADAINRAIFLHATNSMKYKFEDVK